MRRTLRRSKRLRRRRKVKSMKDRALYEAWTSGISPPLFKSECPDINLVKPIIEKLGPGGIIGDGLTNFELGTPDPEDSVIAASAMLVHFLDLGRRFNKSVTSDVMTCPLVYDTGASSGLTPFKSDFLDDCEIVRF